MTDGAPNVSTLWGRILVDELVSSGVAVACVTPGSRSTPLTLAFVEHDDATVYSHLDERSAAFFALGRSKRTGSPTALVCTSGTAAANYHPAVVEADESRTPLVVCTADRPPELDDSGANQTTDQDGLYRKSVRWERTLPEPEAEPRKLRSIRVAVDRAVTASRRDPAGPVHLNVPFRKPLAPTRPTDGVPAELDDGAPGGAGGRDGPFLDVTAGRRTLPGDDLDALTAAVGRARRGLVVAGPADPTADAAAAIADLAAATGFPLLADPLSGLRYGPHVADATVCGGYDGYLHGAVTDDWPAPDLVLRFGASPTSKALREYLGRAAPRQLLVDPGGGWREATFTATDLVEADPAWLAGGLAERIGGAPGGQPASEEWVGRFRRAEAAHWAVLDEAAGFEGSLLAAVVGDLPDQATVFASNSTPVRDIDRYGRPDSSRLTVLGNRGASGVDGITSTALGAASATDDPLVLLTGDLAYYHDTNGLLAVSRCDVDATIVVFHNDGGGIFHRLPIAEHPAFEEWFRTPHGLDFSPTADLFDLTFERAGSVDALRAACSRSVGAEGATVVVVETDAAESQRVRERVRERVGERLADDG